MNTETSENAIEETINDSNEELPIEPTEELPNEEEVIEQESEVESPEENEDVEEETNSEFQIDESEPKAEKQAPTWVKKLRKDYRELKKAYREEKKKNESLTGDNSEDLTLGPKPNFDDFDYDSDKFSKALDEWYTKKRKVDEHHAKQESERLQQQREWESKVEKFNQSKSSINVSDFSEMEDLVQENLSEIQIGIILEGAENPAKVIYALGKNPKKLEELSEIDNHVRFTYQIAKIEEVMKSRTIKPETSPEKVIKGNMGSMTSSETHLERLRDEAAKTGDMTKVIAYKQKLRQKQLQR